jgi:hypothetical protein
MNPQKKQSSLTQGFTASGEGEEGQGFFESSTYLFYKFCNSSLSRILVNAAQ